MNLEDKKILENLQREFNNSREKIADKFREDFQLIDKIIVEIFKSLEKSPPETFDVNSFKKGIVLSVLTKSVRLSWAIMFVCQYGFGDEASILLRTLMENLFNLGYILKDETDETAKKFLKFDWIIRSKQLNVAKDFIPELVEELRNEREEILREIEAQKEKLKGEYPRLDWSGKTVREKAKIADLEELYLVYDQCSIDVHGNARSLNKVISMTDGGELSFDLAPSERSITSTLVATSNAMIKVFSLTLDTFDLQSQDVISELAERFKRVYEYKK